MPRKKVKDDKAKTKTRIVAALRKIWFYSKLRRDAIKEAKDGDLIICAICGMSKDKVHVDHIKPITGLKGEWSWDTYINNLLFCNVNDLQVLCVDCHNTKTQIERKLRTKNKTVDKGKKK